MDSERTNGHPDEGVPEHVSAEQPPNAPPEPSLAQAPVVDWPTPQRPQRASGGSNALRVFVGAAISILVMSLLYGFNNAIGVVALAVICTAGLSLLLIIPGCWLVGWVAIAAWEAIARQLATRTAP